MNSKFKAGIVNKNIHNNINIVVVIQIKIIANKFNKINKRFI